MAGPSGSIGGAKERGKKPAGMAPVRDPPKMLDSPARPCVSYGTGTAFAGRLSGKGGTRCDSPSVVVLAESVDSMERPPVRG